MIFVDTVYQRVLALANKEQRGYITPQEFNLLACQAQLEIIEQYFYDINRFGRFHGNDTEYSDMLNLINEKVLEITTSTTLTVAANTGLAALPGDLYKMGTITTGGVEADFMSVSEVVKLNNSILTRPYFSESSKGVRSPVYTKQGGNIILFPLPTSTYLQGLTTAITYIEQPKCPYWGYVVVDEKAMYNEGASVNFILHASEESELVNRILGLAGITIQKPELTSAALQLEGTKQQIEKQ